MATKTFVNPADEAWNVNLAWEDTEVDGSGDLAVVDNFYSGAGPESPSGEYFDGQYGQHFTLSGGSNVTLGDCVIDAETSGTSVIELWKYDDATQNPEDGTKVDEVSLSVSAGEQTVMLGLTTDGDGDYWVGMNSGPSLMRTDEGQDYPWTSADGNVEFVEGRQFDSSSTNDRWYYFFDLQVDSLIFGEAPWRASNGWDPELGDVVDSSLVEWTATGDVVGEVAVSDTDPTSLYFDGEDDKGSIDEDNGGFSLNTFSVGVWFRIDAAGSETYPMIAKGGSDWQRQHFNLNMSTSGTVGSSSGQSDGSGTFVLLAESTSTYDDGQWHFAVLVIDSTEAINTAKIYVDGDEVADDSTEHDIGTWDDKIEIGHRRDKWLKGYLSGAWFYNRALSESEISDLYQGKHISSGLVGHWKLDEGTGSTAYDSAGSNDGTITGASWRDGESPLYRPATSGQPIPGISQGDDLSGKKIYGRQKLNASDATMQEFKLTVSTAAAMTASRRMRSRIF